MTSKYRVPIIALICVLLVSCYRMPFVENTNTKIINLDESVSGMIYTSKQDTILVSEDIDKINNVLHMFNNAQKDISSDDFKSFSFVYFMHDDSVMKRIEVLENRYRVNGRRYSLDEDIHGFLEKNFQGM